MEQAGVWQAIVIPKMFHRASPRLRALASETMRQILGQVLDCSYLNAPLVDSHTGRTKPTVGRKTGLKRSAAALQSSKPCGKDPEDALSMKLNKPRDLGYVPRRFPAESMPHSLGMRQVNWGF